MNAPSAPLRISMSTRPGVGGVFSALALFALVVFVAISTIVVSRTNTRDTDLALAARTKGTINSIDERLSAYNEVLYGVRHFFEQDVSVSRRGYHDLSSRLDVDSRHPGVQVVGAAHVVERGDLDAYTSDVNAAAGDANLDYPAFEVYPETSAPQVLAIDFIEPQIGNERAFGLDFFSEESRRTAALLARDTNAPAATAPVTLVQETGEQRAFLVMLPLYRPGELTNTVERRRAAFTGVVYAAFRMDDLMAGILGDENTDEIAITDVETEELVYLSGDADRLTTLDESNLRVKSVDIAGRLWRVAVDNESKVLSPAQRFQPLIIVIAGLSVAALFAALIKSMRSSGKRAMAIAAEMTDELEALTESTSEAIVSVNAAGTIVAWNRGAARTFGESSDDALGRAASGLVPERYRDSFENGLKDLVVGRHSDSFGEPIRLIALRASGEEFPVEITISTWSARGRQFQTAFVRDLTSRIAAEQQLRETTDMLSGVLGAATEMSIIGTDVDGVITVFSGGAENMLGYRAEDVIGVGTPAFIHDVDEVVERAAELGLEPGFDVFIDSARRGEPETRTWTYICNDGQRLPVELTVTPRYDGDGVLCGFIGVGVDITKRIAAETVQQDLLDQQREIVAKLREVDRAKNDFVSTMSHELRTPLTSIIGYAELLMDIEPSHALDMVQIIEKNAQRLLALVEDILSLSQIESGTFQIKLAPCDTQRILRAACVAIAPLANDHGVRLVAELESLPTIIGDGPRLERVFLNLLSNAVKFSRPGGIVEVAACADDRLTVTVTDYGIGIPDDEQDRLFTRFFRSRNAQVNAVQGTGLGLSIVANIIERHGGTIDIRSEQDVGTTVVVELPMVTTHDKQPMQQEAFV